MLKNIFDDQNLINILSGGGIAVIPTDTIYGMVGQAKNPKTVDRIYEIRKRDLSKPFIILVGDISELEKFSIVLSELQKKEIQKYWLTLSQVEGFIPTTERARPTSIILDCPSEELSYLHRGNKSLAFRLPALAELRTLLMKVGPLVAPSANIEKFPESESISDAKAYFGDLVDVYIDVGPIVSKPSRLIRLHPDGTVGILRE